MFTIEHLIVGAWKAVCYTPTNEEDTLIIDPGAEPRTFMRWFEDKEVIGVVLTHCHSDHIGVVNELVEAHGCPMACGVDDVDGVADVHRSGFDEKGTDYIVGYVDRSLAEGDVITRGGDTLQVLHTSRHTPGSICLLGAEQWVLFSGDTLFSGAIGSTVFVLGDYAELMRSYARFSQMDSLLTVYPGHGPATTLRTEKPMLSYLVQNTLHTAGHSSNWREGSW